MISSETTYNQLKKLQSVLLKQNIPFVSYRLPLQQEIITLVQHHSFPEKLDSLNDIGEKTGFIVAPFTEKSLHATYFLKPDCIFFSNEIEDSYIQKLANNNRFQDTKKPSIATYKTTSSNEFIGNVNASIEGMSNHQFHKVVISKIRIENTPDDFNPHDFYLKLCDRYPHAFVYFMQLPEVGCWIGATPEPLLEIESKSVKTVSLAGTQIATNDQINSYQWANKELEEQNIVTDFVEKTIRSLGVTNYSKIGPNNYQAANLIHLKTAFEFSSDQLQNNFGNFIKALHPTPSVGGLPKQEALNFILSNELHDRSYYTGFMGPLNINKKTNIFVNLRCLQLFENQFVLYSGAGITSSSVAEKEWLETDNKMKTLLNVMYG